jgi:hypothetical protein
VVGLAVSKIWEGVLSSTAEEAKAVYVTENAAVRVERKVANVFELAKTQMVMIEGAVRMELRMCWRWGEVKIHFFHIVLQQFGRTLMFHCLSCALGWWRGHKRWRGSRL